MAENVGGLHWNILECSGWQQDASDGTECQWITQDGTRSHWDSLNSTGQHSMAQGCTGIQLATPGSTAWHSDTEERNGLYWVAVDRTASHGTAADLLVAQPGRDSRLTATGDGQPKAPVSKTTILPIKIVVLPDLAPSRFTKMLI